MIHKTLDRFTAAVAKLSSVVLIVVALFTLVNIISRAVFNTSVSGAIEVVQYGMMICVGLILCRTGFNKRHIAVTILIDKFPARLAGSFRAVTTLITTVVFGYVSYYFFKEIGEMAEGGRVSEILHFPYWTMYLIMAICFLMATVIFIYLTVTWCIGLFAPPEKNVAGKKDEDVDIEAQLS
ncbi:MAG: TRAP transporter small permease [Oscillospiraceae bacterium]|nr:TRAP transporter small permease [Oscillospiraceae bacterium]